jgi:hypothetical protein
VLLPLLSFLLVKGALASESLADWQALHDARLLLSADADFRGAIQSLERLDARLEPEDSLRGDVALSLAHARYAIGLAGGARDALTPAAAVSRTAASALAFEAQLDAIENRIQGLPFKALFAGGPQPFVRSWHHAGQGTLRLSTRNEDPALLWRTIVRDRQDDQIQALVAEGLGLLHGFRCQIRGAGFPSWLRLLALDDRDREFASEPFLVDTREWKALDTSFSSLHFTDPTAFGVRLDPSRVTLIALHDVTSYLSADRGQKEVWIDDVEIW